MQKKVSLLRVLGAIFYDFFLVFSLVFTLIGISVLLKLDKNLVFWMITLPASYFYFVASWVKSGQTIGMKAWDIKIVGANYQSATIRFFASIFSWMLFGFGYLYILFNKQNYSLHDRLSQTFLVYFPKK